MIKNYCYKVVRNLPSILMNVMIILRRLFLPFTISLIVKMNTLFLMLNMLKELVVKMLNWLSILMTIITKNS